MERGLKYRRFIILIMAVAVVCLLIFASMLTTYLSRPHALIPISPADDLPSEDIGPIRAGSLVFTITPTFDTFSFHSGEKGVNCRLDISIENVESESVDDLCFHKMTMYWANGEANFTSGLNPEINYSIRASQTIDVELRNTYTWPGIPYHLCWQSAWGYGRLMLSFNTDDFYILSTALTPILNLVE